MSNYTKTTNFAAKDSLLHGNPAKVVKGSEIDAEFTAIAAAVATKMDGTISNFTFTEVAGVLYIASSGTNVMSVDGSGNLTVIGNVISNGSI